MIRFFSLFSKIDRVLAQGCIFCIKLYQKTLSPDHGWFKERFPYGYCKFSPSCSEYAVQCFKKYNVVRAFQMTIWRILRCNPCSKGGDDHP